MKIMSGWHVCRWDKSVPFDKSDYWKLYLGFFKQHQEVYSTDLDQGFGN